MLASNPFESESAIARAAIVGYASRFWTASGKNVASFAECHQLRAIYGSILTPGSGLTPTKRPSIIMR
jgi:hypothetical protein